MLSRKQIWRKSLRERPSKATELTSTYDENDEEDIDISPKPLIREQSDLDSHASTVSLSIEDSLSMKSKSSVISAWCSPPILHKKKNISFSSFVKVCLIPTRYELLPLAHDLYYSCQECDQFKQDAFTELNMYSKQHNCSLRQAITSLYQYD